jgi:hypothetical protein
MINEGFFPMVYYLTNINLKDTTALKLENEKVQKEVADYLRVLTKTKNMFSIEHLRKCQMVKN